MAWSDEDIVDSKPAGWSDADVAELKADAARLAEQEQSARDTTPKPSDEIVQSTGEANPDFPGITSGVDWALKTGLPMVGGTMAYGAAAKYAGAPLAKAIAARTPATVGKVANWLLPKALGGAAGGGVEEGLAGRDPVAGAMYGAMLGPAIEGGIQLGGKVLGAGMDLAGGTKTRVGKQLREVFPEDGGRRQAAIDALRNRAPTGVIGEQSTVGSLATPQFPEFGALEAGFRNRPGASRFTDIDAANAKARLDMLEPVAQFGRKGRAVQGGKVPMSASEQVRFDTTKPLYDRAGFDRMPVEDKFNRLMGSPGPVQDAINAGHRRFENMRDTWSYKGGKARPKRAKLDPEGNIVDISIAEMDQIRGEIDKRVNDLFRQGKGAEADIMKEFRDSLTAQMEKHSANYATARNEYRRLSQPVNESHLMEELTKRLRSPAGTETGDSFLNAVRNQENALTASAVGKPRFQQFEQVLSPESMGRVNAVTESLRRKAVAGELPKGQGMLGDKTPAAEQLRELTPGLFDKYITTAKKALEVAGKKMSARDEKLLGDAIVDPDKLAQLLERVPPSERSVVLKAIEQARRPVSAYETTKTVQEEYQED